MWLCRCVCVRLYVVADGVPTMTRSVRIGCLYQSDPNSRNPSHITKKKVTQVICTHNMIMCRITGYAPKSIRKWTVRKLQFCSDFNHNSQISCSLGRRARHPLYHCDRNTESGACECRCQGHRHDHHIGHYADDDYSPWRHSFQRSER